MSPHMRRVLRPHRYQPQGEDRFQLQIDTANPLCRGLIAAMVPAAFIAPGEAVSSSSPNASYNPVVGRWGVAYSVVRGYMSSLDTPTMSIVARPYLPVGATGNYNAYGINYWSSANDNFAFGFGYIGTTTQLTIWARSNTTAPNNANSYITVSSLFENHFCVTTNGWGQCDLFLDGSSTSSLTVGTTGTYRNDSRKIIMMDPLQRVYYCLIYNRLVSRAEDNALMRDPWQVFKKREIWVPRQRIISLPRFPTLSAAEIAAFTSTTARPRVTVTY